MHPGCAAQWTFLHSLDDTLDLLESVGGAPVKMVLDTYHLGQDGGLLDRIAEMAPRSALVQLGDARRRPTANRIAAAWARASCRWARSSPR